ncbi:MAG TPA: hypothetical protein VLI90_15970 [Tepidisphaeraceae bacterium]|nr:hypothetical protein [Tepidisphaeraceae bacterium]
MSSVRFRLILLFAIIALTASIAPACEMCRDAVITNGGGGGIDGTASSAGLNFNSSIFFMLGGVFAVAGWIGWIMYKAIQSSQATPAPRGFPVKSNVG